MTAVRVLALTCLVMLAGCAGPFVDGEETPTEGTPAPLVLNESSTDTPADGAGETPTPVGTALPETSDELVFPPGVSGDGIDDADALFRNHTEALEATGFVAIGNGSSVVNEHGLLVDVETNQRNRVAANGTAYDIQRDATAGPIERSVHVWSNGSVEYVHRQENGDSNYTVGEPRSMPILTGNGLLGPYIRGGDFEVQEYRNTSDGTLVVLNATEIANATVLERAITGDAEEATSYDALAVIDEDGRIHFLDATIEFVVGGQTETQEFTYELTSVEDTEIPDPDWLEEARDATDGTADAASDENVESAALAT